MSRLRIQLLAGTSLVAIASFAGASAASASVEAKASGTGATALAAERAADLVLHGNYFGCGTLFLASDVQNADGTWSAEVTAVCKGFN